MGLKTGILGALPVAALALVGIAAAACGGGGTGGTGGSAGAGGGGGSGGGASCAPGDACAAVVDECLGYVDNTDAATFGLRIGQLNITKPATLADGAVASIVAQGVFLDQIDCNLSGEGTFNWLIEVDSATGDVTTGGAKPVADPAAGFSFVNEPVEGVDVAPVVLAGAYSNGAINATTGTDVVVPIYLDADATSVVLLPLKQARLLNATVSAGQSCIGKYNAAELDPANNCFPDSDTSTFTDGGELDGFITLEDSDNILVSSLNASLCTLLAGVNDGGSPKKCPRDPATMEFTTEVTDATDWCTATNAAKTAYGADAFQLSASFAAQSVTIN